MTIRLTTAAAAVAGLLLFAPVNAGAEPQDFTLTNDTGYDIRSVNIFRRQFIFSTNGSLGFDFDIVAQRFRAFNQFLTCNISMSNTCGTGSNTDNIHLGLR